MKRISEEAIVKAIVGRDRYEELLEAVCKAEGLRPGDDATEIEARFARATLEMIRTLVTGLDERDILFAYYLENGSTVEEAPPAIPASPLFYHNV